jgi:hypothetical protein
MYGNKPTFSIIRLIFSVELIKFGKIQGACTVMEDIRDF